MPDYDICKKNSIGGQRNFISTCKVNSLVLDKMLKSPTPPHPGLAKRFRNHPGLGKPSPNKWQLFFSFPCFSTVGETKLIWLFIFKNSHDYLKQSTTWVQFVPLLQSRFVYSRNVAPFPNRTMIHSKSILKSCLCWFENRKEKKKNEPETQVLHQGKGLGWLGMWAKLSLSTKPISEALLRLPPEANVENQRSQIQKRLYAWEQLWHSKEF